MLSWLGEFFKAEEGQGMVEYGLIVGLIAIIVIAVFVALGPRIAGLFNGVLSEAENAQSGVRNSVESDLGSDT